MIWVFGFVALCLHAADWKVMVARVGGTQDCPRLGLGHVDQEEVAAQLQAPGSIGRGYGWRREERRRGYSIWGLNDSKVRFI